jgi:hypothetical protein
MVAAIGRPGLTDRAGQRSGNRRKVTQAPRPHRAHLQCCRRRDLPDTTRCLRWFEKQAFAYAAQPDLPPESGSAEIAKPVTSSAASP